jgi:hypothetical protein
MRIIVAPIALSLFVGPLSAGVVDNDSSASVTVFAVGDVADCSSRNPYLVPAASLSEEEVAEHQLQGNELLPSDPLGIEELIEDQSGIVLGLGDLAYSKGTIEQYRDCFRKVWQPMLSRVHPVPGNHEYKTGARGYKSFWGAAAGGPGNFYSFDYGSWHLIALNSEIDSSVGSPQATFLERDLAKAQDHCVLAYFHRPAFASLHRSGSHQAKELFRLLEKHGVTIVLNGHNHYYERTALLDGDGHRVAATGIREFVVGTGGKSEDYGRIDPAPFTEKLIVKTTGVLRLDLTQKDYRWEFIAAPSGEILDAGEGVCRPVK